MAFDAGWNSIIPYTNVDMGELQTLVQDTIFSIIQNCNGGIIPNRTFDFYKNASTKKPYLV